MQQQIKVPKGVKEPLYKKAETVIENVKEKVEKKAEGFISKARESELAEKTREKLGDLKESSKSVFNKVTDKFHGKN